MSMSTIPITNSTFFICPSCKIEIPYMKPQQEEEKTFFIFNCSCSKESIKLDLNEYLTILTEQSAVKAQKCEKSKHDKEAEKYCLNCQRWMCSDCLEYHQDFLPGHILNEKKMNLACLVHKESFEWYCNDCKQSICIKCEKEHENHHKENLKAPELLQLLQKNIILIQKANNDYRKEREDFNQTIDNIILHFNKLRDNVNKLCDDNETRNLQLEKLYTIFIESEKIIKTNPSHAFNQSVISLEGIKQKKLDLKEIKEILLFIRKYDKLLLVTNKNLFTSFTDILQEDIQNLIKPMLSVLSKTHIKYNMIFDAKRDGFNAAAFHSYCDEKGPTLTVIKTTKGYVFGGYTSQSWEFDVNGKYKTDNNAFLFSLGLQKIYPIAKLKSAIYCYSQYGPTFGGGHEIFIANNSLIHNRSYCCFPHSYCNGVNNEFNGNESNFIVENYQVYKVFIN